MSNVNHPLLALALIRVLLSVRLFGSQGLGDLLSCLLHFFSSFFVLLLLCLLELGPPDFFAKVLVSDSASKGTGK